jgi:Protein of unknown function (DUF1761)
MPNIFGLKIVPVLLATLAFWLLGYLWYGVVFMDAWMAGHELPTDGEGGFDIYMIGGILTTLLQVIGIGLILKWKGVGDIMGAMKTALVIWLLIALPLMMYAYLYLPAHNSTLLMIDASHLLVGWVISAVILAVMK